jgi:hypothetical protein
MYERKVNVVFQIFSKFRFEFGQMDYVSVTILPMPGLSSFSITVTIIVIATCSLLNADVKADGGAR